MCLDLKKFAIPRIALKDITVYKFLRQIDSGITPYVTPYRHSPISIGETYTSKLERNGSFFKESSIDKGIHSLKSISNAKDLADLNSYIDGLMVSNQLKVIEEANRNYKTHVVVECIIPAGSIYYVGIFGAYDKKSYASNKLKYVKIVENENNK
jgi:hypothetical protein